MPKKKKIVVRSVQGYGWMPDLPDQRDFSYSAPTPLQRNLPDSIDLSSKCPPVYDQGQLGSCTANAIAAAVEYEHKKKFTPSRLFIYYNERAMEGTIDSDSGAQIRDGIKSVVTQGAPPERLWPYQISKFRDKPSAEAYSAGDTDQVVLYQRLAQDLNTMKGCLASKYPFVFGFTAYESFEGQKVAKTGILGMPGLKEKIVGGHAVLAVGYDDATRTFLVRNSWGPDWGLKGYYKMPYGYLINPKLASDFWTIRGVEEGVSVAKPKKRSKLRRR